MKEIPLTYRSVKVLVDDEDFEILSKYIWHQHKTGYANHPQLGLMHRWLMKAPDGMDVDHINRNKLDNRRNNLRIVPRGFNVQNKVRPNSLGYTGIYWNKAGFSAEIRFNKKRYYLGRFETKEEAALAYNTAALKFYGPHAYINKLD